MQSLRGYQDWSTQWDRAGGAFLAHSGGRQCSREMGEAHRSELFDWVKAASDIKASARLTMNATVLDGVTHCGGKNICRNHSVTKTVNYRQSKVVNYADLFAAVFPAWLLSFLLLTARAHLQWTDGVFSVQSAVVKLDQIVNIWWGLWL